ncbi:MAG: HAD family hydrolase [Eubacterium sp.]|nr:HAD family hydrolase [Eubacterium sp.]
MKKQLVVADMDGTLLNSNKEMTDRTLSAIREISRRGVIFTAASGRPRECLTRQFPGIPVATISDNGSTVYDEKGRLIFSGGFSWDQIRPVFEAVSLYDFMHPVFCGLKNLYVLKGSDEETRLYTAYYLQINILEVEDISEIYQMDKIVKLSVHTNKDGSEEAKGYEILEPFADDFFITLSGDGWIDIQKKGCTKGDALMELCSYLGVDKKDVYVFGDYLNDFDMLSRFPNSYCMLNGHPDVKAVCSHVTRYSNNEDGVARELEEIFALDMKADQHICQ